MFRQFSKWRGALNESLALDAFFVMLPVEVSIISLAVALRGDSMARGKTDGDSNNPEGNAGSNSNHLIKVSNTVLAVAAVATLFLSGIISAITATWVISSKLNDGFNGFQKKLDDGFSGFREKLDRIEKKENASAAKIRILAMDLPADKKRDLLETVDKMEAILPSNSLMAVKMVLEGRTSDMATFPKVGTMDFNNH